MVIGRQGWPAGTRAGPRTPGLTRRRRSLDEQPRRFRSSKAHQQRPGWQRTCKYIDLVGIERPARAPLFCGPHLKYAKFTNFGSYVRTIRVFRMSGSPVAVRAGASLFGRSLLPHVWQHSASLRLADIPTWCVVPRTLSSYGDRTFAAAGPRLWNPLPVQPAAQSKHHLRTVQTTAEETPFLEAWIRRSVTSGMRRLRKTFTYLLTAPESPKTQQKWLSVSFGS